MQYPVYANVCAHACTGSGHQKESDDPSPRWRFVVNAVAAAPQGIRVSTAPGGGRAHAADQGLSDPFFLETLGAVADEL
jgi:hypothetical protein